MLTAASYGSPGIFDGGEQVDAPVDAASEANVDAADRGRDAAPDASTPNDAPGEG
jgi:hypothetical protein